MKILVTLLSLFLLASFSGSEKLNTDVEKDQLKGKVKMLKQEKYYTYEEAGKVVVGGKVKGDGHNFVKFYNEKGYLTEMTDHLRYSSTVEKKVYKYDDTGKLVEIKEYNMGDTLTCITIFKYDPKGNEIEKSNNFQLGEKRIGKETWKYDEKRNCIQYNDYGFGSTAYMKWVYKYDSKGNQTNWNCFDAKGIADNRYIYIYNESGQVIEMKKFEKDNRHDEIHSYSYDENGNKIVRTLTYPNKSGNEEETWKYDDKNNMTEWKQEGGLYRTYGYTYEYDAQGNWTKRTQVENNYEDWNTKTKKMDYRNNVPVAIATRTLEYYQ